VTVPLTASLCVSVDAETEDAAIEKALDMSFRLSVKVEEDAGAFLGEEVMLHRTLIEGNVSNAVLNEAFAELDYEDEEEVEEGSPE
jgi:hypothetical protein